MHTATPGRIKLLPSLPQHTQTRTRAHRRNLLLSIFVLWAFFLPFTRRLLAFSSFVRSSQRPFLSVFLYVFLSLVSGMLLYTVLFRRSQPSPGLVICILVRRGGGTCALYVSVVPFIQLKLACKLPRRLTSKLSCPSTAAVPSANEHILPPLHRVSSFITSDTVPLENNLSLLVAFYTGALR